MFYVSILGWSFFILSCLRFLCTFIHSLQKILDVIFHYYFSSFTNGLNNLQSGSLTHLTLHTYTQSQKKKCAFFFLLQFMPLLTFRKRKIFGSSLGRSSISTTAIYFDFIIGLLYHLSFYAMILGQ